MKDEVEARGLMLVRRRARLWTAFLLASIAFKKNICNFPLVICDL